MVSQEDTPAPKVVLPEFYMGQNQDLLRDPIVIRPDEQGRTRITAKELMKLIIQKSRAKDNK